MELIQIGGEGKWFVIPLIGLGTYALKESGKHRRIQWRNRRLVIELASIDPYLTLFEGTGTAKVNNQPPLPAGTGVEHRH